MTSMSVGNLFLGLLLFYGHEFDPSRQGIEVTSNDGQGSFFTRIPPSSENHNIYNTTTNNNNNTNSNSNSNTNTNTNSNNNTNTNSNNNTNTNNTNNTNSNTAPPPSQARGGGRPVIPAATVGTNDRHHHQTPQHHQQQKLPQPQPEEEEEGGGGGAFGQLFRSSTSSLVIASPMHPGSNVTHGTFASAAIFAAFREWYDRLERAMGAYDLGQAQEGGQHSQPRLLRDLLVMKW
eukprot:CAMPEP_0185790908 /NCGR_PEP_ID=MMETSP1174-20130828/158071_1 /TAXON_ID=35687 /ORGANISM="Dictyocha speculum, Strain CCMP1381" /LENGTH=233 /DNA_ID=CAMNT_0028485779 /DNA_START=171 /DNA_END=869 /DNA_ORIENTATION=+